MLWCLWMQALGLPYDSVLHLKGLHFLICKVGPLGSVILSYLNVSDFES